MIMDTTGSLVSQKGLGQADWNIRQKQQRQIVGLVSECEHIRL
jgi:hypothetical protein